MLRFSKLFLLLAILFSGITACRKDSLITKDITKGPDTSIKFETWVLGVVNDELGQPITDAIVTMGSATTLTSVQGVFRLKGKANQVQPFITVEKAGYYPSIVSFSSKVGDTGRVKVILVAKQLSGSLQAVSGGTISISGGGRLKFPDYAFKTAKGESYSGEVNVYATYIDPSKPDHANRIPGAFQGVTEEGDLAVLKSYGMVKVLIETPIGQPLQLQKEVELIMPIPSDRIASAPATIPLWYIDPVTSLWREEGVALRNGDQYIGQVAHFSWWNCDLPVEQIKIKGKIMINSTPPFLKVKVTSNGWEITTTVGTSGEFQGPVPANQIITLEVFDECGMVVHSGSYGPYSVDTDLGTINVTSSANFILVSGTLLNCNDDPVINGYVVIKANATYNFPIAVDPVSGAFEGNISNCTQDDLQLVGYDLNALKASEPILVPYSPTIDFGIVIACDVALEFGLTLEYNGQTKFFPNLTVQGFPDSVGGLFYVFSVEDNQGGGNVVGYNYTIADFGGPSSPSWQFYGSYQHSGDPLIYLAISGEIQPISIGSNPGDIIHFELKNAVVVEKPSGIEYTNAKVKLIAPLQ